MKKIKRGQLVFIDPKIEISKKYFTDPFLARRRYTLYNDEPCLAYNIHTYDSILADHPVY
jgi:hypothetical protein